MKNEPSLFYINKLIQKIRQLNLLINVRIFKKWYRFPPNDFKCYFTLFSECYFIFPSRYLFAIGLLPLYLAFDGIYHRPLGCTLKQPDS